MLVHTYLHRCQRRHRRRYYILRTEFSEDAARFLDAMGFRLVSLDSIARMVRFRPLDFVSNDRHSRAESRNEFRLLGAHLGGAAVGILAWLLWRKPNNGSPLLE